MSTQLIKPKFILSDKQIEKMNVIIEREHMGDIDTFVSIAVKFAINSDILSRVSNRK